MEKWTLKQVIKTKFIWVFLLTILFTLLATKLINQIFTSEVTLDSSFIHTTNVHLNIPAMFVLAIPIGFISLLRIQLFMNKFSKQKPSDSRNGFTWYSLYGIILGFITLIVYYQQLALGFMLTRLLERQKKYFGRLLLLYFPS